MYASPRQRTSLLRADIRSELAREAGEDDEGGDFHTPFWADVKRHVAGELDLRSQSKLRIEKNKARARLYPLLTDGFLRVWTEKIRWRNEEFEFVPQNVSGSLPIGELRAVVKIANVAAVKIWDGNHRVVYPYFSEAPELPIEAARLGFWVLGEALPQFDPNEIRIIDVLRASYFRPDEVPLQGNERRIFISRYDGIIREWERLREEYLVT
ncbi:MAG: hypothetical protein WCE79_21105 [Xanthobacteraceae bacterium]